MLSHQYQPSNMHTRQQHRRQQSTPTVFEAQSSCVTSAHRRGMTVPSPGAHGLPLQEHHMVSMTTNPGHPPQHYMQVAHPAAQAQPGQPQPFTSATPGPRHLSAEEYRRIQHQLLDQQLGFAPPQSVPTQLAFEMERSRSNPESYNGMSLTAQSASHPYQHQRPGSSRSDGQSDYKSPLHVHGNGPLQRPFTPPNQGNPSQSPITPATTPYHQHALLKSEQIVLGQTLDPNVVSEHGHVSPRRSPQPAVVCEERMIEDEHGPIRSAERSESIQALTYGEYLMHDANDEVLPSPPQTVAIKQGRTFDVTTMPAVSLEAMPRLELHPTQGEPGMLMGGQDMRRAHSDIAQLRASPPLSQHGSQSMGDFGEFTGLHSPQGSFHYGSQYGSPTRGAISPKGIPMEDLSLEATIEDTGVSSEEVQSYIAEPTDADIKWTCLFPDCGKKFGRKENIRSHVQTHLGDRQFKCIHCNKCFVRQHDLKRHSKIHSGVKPYLCRCGADFARHDALTRHRTRGVCIGAFEGVVKKYAKRGRPKKEHRPDDEERYNKAARTQKRVAAKAANNDCDSYSGTDYNSSWPNSPEEETLRASVELEMQAVYSLSQQGSPQQISGQQLEQHTLSFAPSAFSVTPPQSPNSTAQYGSPQKTPATQHSAPSPAASEVNDDVKIVIEAHSNFQETLTQPGSQASSPPELSHSSPPSSAQMMEYDFSSSGSALPGMGSEGGFEGRDFSMFEGGEGGAEDLFGDQWGGDNSFFNFEKASMGVRMDNGEFTDELSMF